MRFGLLVPLLLPLLAAPGAAANDPTFPGPAAEVVVRSGRVRLVVGREVVSLTGRDPARAFRRPVHLELGPRAEVEVVWRGLASLRVRGPASFGIEPGTDPLAPRAGFFFFRTLEVEVRRGAPRLTLPRGWSLAPGRGALGVRELADGRLELVHHGGEPARLASGREQAGAMLVPSGTRVRLPATPRRL